jgi:hypothetical protein
MEDASMSAAGALPSIRRLVTLAVVAVVVTALSGAVPAAANPAADGGKPMPLAPNEPAAVGMHCQVVLDKVRPGESSSRVLSSQCARAGQTLVAPRASVPILTIYEHLNYGGRSKTFYGSAGPCDASGYAINDVGGIPLHPSWWRTRVSSLYYGNNCIYQNGYTGFNRTGTCAHYHHNTGYVGASMNDRIVSFRVSSELRLCAWG